jgi:hypothetical protein
MTTLARLLMLLIAVVALVGCRPEKKVGKERAIRKECNKPSWNCYERCVNRDASKTCTGCCGDQRKLCDTGQTPNWAYCDEAQ